MRNYRVYLAIALLLATGSFLSSSWEMLLVGWIIAAFESYLAGYLKHHASFVAKRLTPIALMLFIVYGFFVKPRGNGFIFAFNTTSRLAITASSFLLALGYGQSDIAHILYSWGLRGNLLVIAAAGSVLAMDMKNRASKVITARLARGFVPRRSLFYRLIQVPFTLRPLLAGSLSSAIERSASWQQKNLLTRMSEIYSKSRTQRYSSKELISLTLAIAWTASVFLCKISK